MSEFPRLSKPENRMSARAGIPVVLLCLAGLLMLSACGKKATQLDPPDETISDQFPRSYPDPMTDPKPVSAPR